MRALPKKIPPQAGNFKQSHTLTSTAFSLFEMLIVLGIAAILISLILPYFSSIGSGQNLSQSATEIQSILTLAKSEAVQRDSYVFVGFYESDGSKSDMVRPAPSGIGRVWIGVAVTQDGTQGYNLTNTNAWSVSNLSPLGKLRHFDNLHLATNASFFTASNNTVSPIGDTSATNAPFGWPLNNSNTVTAFTSGVIQFSPSGAASLPGSTAATEYIQLALIPTHGNNTSSTMNAAVIQVDSITGAVRMFRP